MSMLLHSLDPNFVQGSATAALSWVVYDVVLTLDREISSVWRASWSISKGLFLFSRYHTILALGFFLMEAIGTKHFTLPLNIDPSLIPPDAAPGFYAPCIANLKVSIAARWYIGLAEVLAILTGELLILIRINAVYGWSRQVVALTLLLFCAEAVIGLVTTIISLLGGSRGLLGSTDILTCFPGQANVPDVNIAMWCTSMAVVCVYLGLVVHRALTAAQLLETVGGRPEDARMGFIALFRSSQMAPTLHLCLRDAAVYFILIFGVLTLNLLLILFRDRYAQLGTAWLLATYSVASTRIFLNLKDISSAGHRYNDPSWSDFQQTSTAEFHVRSGLSRLEETWTTNRRVFEDDTRPQ
ncbi:hypothetical protein C8R46DRAFT_1192235 [Mycena filopes]|nr:hypothetical protein C8R46DRAFT_1192235 [Mycena filopes]